MSNSGEIWVLQKIGDLADRCGISPTVANIGIDLRFKDDSNDYYYVLSAIHSASDNEIEAEKVEKVWSLLGLDMATGVRTVQNLREAEAIVDNALSLAPRSRVR